MDVEIIRDTICRQGFEMMAGSILRQVHNFTHCYRGLFYPEHGGNPYLVTVPKEDCKKL